jgi:hypothetical protein
MSNTIDQVDLVLSVIFFFVAFMISAKQDRILKRVDELNEWQSSVLEEQHALQIAIMELELLEKLGAIEQGLCRIDDDSSCAPTLLNDSLAGLAVYGLAPDRLENSAELRRLYRNQLSYATVKLLESHQESGLALVAGIVAKAKRFGAGETMPLAMELRGVLEHIERHLGGKSKHAKALARVQDGLKEIPNAPLPIGPPRLSTIARRGGK